MSTRGAASVLLPLQISLTGSRHYNRTFTDSRTLMMSGLSCGACSSPPPSCPESSAQADQCIRCTVPGLSAATNYTVTVAAVSGAGLGAGSSNVTGQTMVFSELTSHGGLRLLLASLLLMVWCTLCCIGTQRIVCVCMYMHSQLLTICTPGRSTTGDRLMKCNLRSLP